MLNTGIAVKILGSILILVASAGLAFQIRRDLSNHLALLYELRRLFVAISYEQAFSMQPLEQLLLQENLTEDERLALILKSVSERLVQRQSKAGELIWQEEFETNRTSLGLSVEELEMIKGAGAALFGKSLEENRRQLNLVLERLDFWIGQTRKERKEKQKVYQTLSVVCGFMLIILLL